MFINAVNRLACAIAPSALLSFVITGCSGESDAANPAQPANQAVVQERFQTAESLLTEFNRITTRDPVDLDATYALFYAENERQKTMIDLTLIAKPVYLLNDAMQRRFKQPIDPAQPTAFVNKANGPATLNAVNGERATATYVESDGKTRTLQLVRYNQRWWISGYTIEHFPELKDATADDLLFARITIRLTAAAAPSLIARIDAGEFKTADDARKALEIAAVQNLMRNPADQQAIRDLAQRNPKYAAMFNAAMPTK